MNSEGAKRFRLLASALSLILLIAVLFGGWFYTRLRASLPSLDGTQTLAGLRSQVRIERDALGIPTIHAADRVDAARALGYLHGQDRFFQMDLLRRKSAGELSELFGKATLTLDKSNRIHGFRTLAKKVVALMKPDERQLIEAYTDGVNAGLRALGAKPFEYYVLRTNPEPWKMEDCVLVDYSMVLTLSDANGNYERTLDTLRSVLGDDALAFFAPLETPEDAALDASTAPWPPIPGPEVINLRKKTTASTLPLNEPSVPGSNSYAVSGAHTATGSALLANDMHLDLAIPNVWYRASMEWGDHRLTGFTLPGTPFLIAGSNGKIAWGFTAAGIDDGDLTFVTRVPNTGLYRIPAPLNGNDMKELDVRTETIRVKGSSPVKVEYEWTIWGPIIGDDADGHPLAHHWTFYDPKAITMGLYEIEQASSADQAVAAAKTSGLPSVNFLVADAQGHIAWTVASFLPKRSGWDGRLPTEWAYGDRHWEGFLPPQEVPSVQDPKDGFLWTANNRILGGDALKLLGDGGYVRPYRAAQGRDDLRELVRTKPSDIKPADLLKIQLDDRAVLLTRWKDVLLSALTDSALAGHPDRADLRERLLHWEGEASVTSVSYGIVKTFHGKLAQFVLSPLLRPCYAADPGFSDAKLDWEAALWRLVQEKPLHLLSPNYADWKAVILDAADATILDGKKAGGLDSFAWGKRNVLKMDHPFSLVLPHWLTGWLNMPAESLPGDTDMPRVQSPSFGASGRFAVSPGHEEQGICEMPGGESGHPLSPYYRAGHEAWVKGEPTAFLPGSPQHTLILQP